MLCYYFIIIIPQKLHIKTQTALSKSVGTRIKRIIFKGNFKKKIIKYFYHKMSLKCIVIVFFTYMLYSFIKYPMLNMK